MRRFVNIEILKVVRPRSLGAAEQSADARLRLAVKHPQLLFSTSDEEETREARGEGLVVRYQVTNYSFAFE